MRTLISCLVLTLLLLARPAAAELVNENLLVEVPSGYEVGFHDKKAKSEMTEMVPEGQTVEDWTEMVTVQIYHDLDATPQQFEAGVQKGWLESCPNGSAHPVASAVEHGYPVLLWMLNCPRNPDTGKPELTWFKALQGNDSFYVVQKAFKFGPSKEQIAKWMNYLKAVKVCDTRLADRACPEEDEEE